MMKQAPQDRLIYKVYLVGSVFICLRSQIITNAIFVYKCVTKIRLICSSFNGKITNSRMKGAVS